MSATAIKDPYPAEYAKSNRSSCKKCTGIITNGSVRLGKKEKAKNFDGVYAVWYHVSCFLSRFKDEVTSSSQISGLSSLRWEDQQKLRAKFGEVEGATEEEDDEEEEEEFDIFAEYASTGRASCKACSEAISKGVARLGKSDTYNGRAAKAWFHVECFPFPKFLENAEDIDGFDEFDKKDQKTVRDAFATEKKKSAKTEKKPAPAATQTKEMKEMEERAKKLWSIRDKFDKKYTTNDLKRMLRENRHSDKGGRPNLLDRCSDGQLNGSIPSCPACKHHAIRFENNTYKCHGHLSEWSKCTFTATTMERGKWRIPEWEEEELVFEKEEKKKAKSTGKRKRGDADDDDDEEEEENDDDEEEEEDDEFCFQGQVIALVGSFDDKDDLIEKIELNGGEVSANVTRKVTLVITTPSENKKARRPAKLQTADKYSIPIEMEDYIDKKLSAYQQKEKKKTANNNKKQKKSTTKSVSKAPPNKKVKKNTVHVQPAVDPFWDGADCAVYGSESEGYYSAILSRADLGDGDLGRNSFYILQLLKVGGTYYIFKRWGRVGDDGVMTDIKFKSAEKAINEFEKTYYKFTGNNWEDRDDFQKRPGKYLPVEIDYGQEDDENSLGELAVAPVNTSTTKLDPRVAGLVAMLFDLEMFEETMKSMNMDIKEMPLGKLSKSQLQRGFTVLKEIRKEIKNEKNEYKLKDATNRFYTIIPHHFKDSLPPIIDTIDLVKQKIEHLEVLADMEVAATLLKENKASKEDPLLAKYNSLKNDISPVQKDSQAWELVENYLNVTCQRPKLELIDVFEVSRHGEADRFKQHNDIKFRKLLWHGTCTAVYAAILSGGMKIMPHSGGRVGKGLYFADICSKSASYCGVRPVTSADKKANDGCGFLLLSEVALGDYHTINTDDPSLRRAPDGYQSILATGTIMPDAKKDHFDRKMSISGNPVQIPQGEIKKTGLSSRFTHNEWLVYKESQVHMKYILKVRWCQ